MRVKLLVLVALLVAAEIGSTEGFRRRRRSTTSRRRRRRTSPAPTPPPTYPNWGQLARPACSAPAPPTINCSTITRSECACECVDRASVCPAHLTCPLYQYAPETCKCNLRVSTPTICATSGAATPGMKPLTLTFLLALVVAALFG